MSVWAILQSYGFTPIEVLRESEVFVTFHGAHRETRAQKISKVATNFIQSQGVLPWRGTEAEAITLAQKLAAVKAEKERREREASKYMDQECARLLGETQ